MDDIMISFQDQEEEALSLCDFPLITSDEPAKTDFSDNQDHRKSPSQPSDFFEFFNNLNTENISHAEDIISGGKLVPYKRQPLFDQQILKSLSGDDDALNSSRRYCESLPEINRPTRSNSGASTRLKRSSRSLDSTKFSRNSSLVMKSNASEFHRSFSKGSLRSEGFKASKPRWYALMFGLVKFPAPEMDLRDIRNRQVRGNTGSMFAALEGGRGAAPANRSDRRSSWGDDLLRVLSCKKHASVAVTASINSLVPQV